MVAHESSLNALYHAELMFKRIQQNLTRALTTAAENTGCSPYASSDAPGTPGEAWPVWQTAASVLFKFNITELSPENKCLTTFGSLKLQYLSSLFFSAVGMTKARWSQSMP